MLYLDHAATTPMRPEARAAMAPFLADVFGNPSGLHGVARTAKNALEDARERAAGILGAAHPLEIVFTGGGTEADNLAVVGAALAGGGGVVTAATEHEAVLESAAFLTRIGRDTRVVGVDGAGRVDVQNVIDSVDDATSVVSVMAANNETGVVQPVAKLATAVHGERPGVVVHTDAVQAFVSEDVTVGDLGVDLLSLAAHKFGGPKGIGLLYVRNGVDLEPVIHGGGQELGRRSGTQNVAGIVGMVAAMEAATEGRDEFRSRVRAERDVFESRLTGAIPDVVVNAPSDARLVQHSHVRIPGVPAETLLIRLDQRGVAASAGSACQSGAIEPSHVLTAMGIGSEDARHCVRFSFGWTTPRGAGSDAAGAVIETVGALR